MGSEDRVVTEQPTGSHDRETADEDFKKRIRSIEDRFLVAKGNLSATGFIARPSARLGYRVSSSRPKSFEIPNPYRRTGGNFLPS